MQFWKVSVNGGKYEDCDLSGNPHGGNFRFVGVFLQSGSQKCKNTLYNPMSIKPKDYKRQFSSNFGGNRERKLHSRPLRSHRYFHSNFPTCFSS